MARGHPPDDNGNGGGAESIIVQSVVVTARVLEALAQAGEPMRVTELAHVLGESKARVYRHLTTLRRLGYVDQEASTERYLLGWKLFQLGQAAAEQFDLRRRAEPAMARLRDATGQTVLLAVPASGEALVIAAMESVSKVSISVKPGNRPPSYCSAQGRVVLAFADDDVRRRMLSRKLVAHTPHSLTDPAAIEKRLKRIRERLWESAPEEGVLGIDTLSAPLFDHADRLVGVLSIIGSIQFITTPPDAKQLALLQGAAAEICRNLNSDAYEQLLGAARQSRASGGTNVDQ
jgi:DNA-binding IclR family transcriptional regulator